MTYLSCVRAEHTSVRIRRGLKKQNRIGIDFQLGCRNIAMRSAEYHFKRRSPDERLTNDMHLLSSGCSAGILT